MRSQPCDRRLQPCDDATRLGQLAHDHQQVRVHRQCFGHVIGVADHREELGSSIGDFAGLAELTDPHEAGQQGPEAG
jgi:hypothetical protein